MQSPMGRCALLVVMSCFLMTSLQHGARAAVITTQQYIDVIDRQQTIDRIDAVLAREEVRKQLKQFGVDPHDAALRVEALTDQELALLATRLEELPAGGDVLGLIGAVFLVLLILELVGVTNIFNRI